MIYYWALALFSVFLQGVNNFCLWPAIVVVLAAGCEKNPGWVYLLAFTAGLITDLATGRLVGQTAVELLVLAGLIFLFKLRFEFNWKWFLTFSFISSVFYHFLG